MTRVLRISDLATTKRKQGRLPVSPSTIWRWVKSGRFPAPFKLSHNVTVWSSDAVDAFLSQRSAPSAVDAFLLEQASASKVEVQE